MSIPPTDVKLVRLVGFQKITLAGRARLANNGGAGIRLCSYHTIRFMLLLNKFELQRRLLV